ncbi:MAG: hypothetical protein EOP05_17835 [Proteobacteria bacterium]|nr:MAG: hypothetical protein EOP05_17835 [Pseudomonadota bacterium]
MKSRTLASGISSGLLALVAALSLTAVSSQAEAYFSVIQTGDLVPAGGFQIVLEPQIITTRYDGLGINAKLDAGIDESSSVRGILGVGDKMEFELGAMYKLIPFPDTASQPAIGFEVGGLYARTRDEGEISLRFNPLISKRFQAEIGDITPYASLPLGITFRDEKTLWPVQLAVGSELRLLNIPQLAFFAEAAFNVHEAFGYISVAAAWQFDEVKMNR